MRKQAHTLRKGELLRFHSLMDTLSQFDSVKPEVKMAVVNWDAALKLQKFAENFDQYGGVAITISPPSSNDISLNNRSIIQTFPLGVRVRSPE